MEFAGRLGNRLTRAARLARRVRTIGFLYGVVAGLGFLVTTVAVCADARPLRVVFVNPSDNQAFDDFVAAFRVAAADLGIEADQYVAAEWPATQIKDVQALLDGPKRPDYLIITIHKGVGIRLIEVAEQARVPVFVINAGLVPEDRARYGGPREKYKYWIGQMLPDDDEAGFLLANILIDRAKALGKVDAQGRVSLVGFGGNPADQSAIERDHGLLRAVADRKDVELLQLVRANWTTEMAARKAPLVFKRYPIFSAFWCANDAMALGVLPEIRKRPAESRPLIAGMDWLPEALNATQDGELVATLGGHFLETAWALILIHDYHAGQDFASEQVDFRTKLYPITQSNIEEAQRCFKERDWAKIDFAKFSKVKNKSLSRYDFSFEMVLEQLRNQEKNP